MALEYAITITNQSITEAFFLSKTLVRFTTVTAHPQNLHPPGNNTLVETLQLQRFMISARGIICIIKSQNHHTPS